MSFLLDRALDFVKYGPFGPKTRSKDENALRHRETIAARKYRRIVIGWMNRGVTEAQLKSKNLWIDEWMKPETSSMGGGISSGIMPEIIPVLTPTTSRPDEKVDPQALAENEAKVALAEAVEESVGDRASAFSILNAIDDANEHILQEEPGAVRESVSPERAEREALFPEIYNAGPDLQYPQNGWQGARREHKPGKPNEKYTQKELKAMYAAAIADNRGSTVDPTYVRDILQMLLAAKRDLTLTERGDTTEATRSWQHVWANTTLEQRSRLIRSMNIAGLVFPSTHHKSKDAPEERKEIVKKILNDPNLLNRVMRISSVQFPNIFNIFRMRDLTSAAEEKEAIAAAERKEEPPISVASWIEQKTPYFHNELKQTGMDARLRDVIINNLNTWANEYGGLMIGDNPEMEYKHSQERAIIGLVQFIRRMINIQKKKDRSLVVNPNALINIIRIVMGAMPSSVPINPAALGVLAADAFNDASEAYSASESPDAFEMFKDMRAVQDAAQGLARDIQQIREAPHPERMQDVSLNPEKLSAKSNALRASNLGTGEEKLEVLSNNTINEIKQQASNTNIALRIGPVSILAHRAIERARNAFRPRSRQAVRDRVREAELLDRIRSARALIVRLEDQNRTISRVQRVPSEHVNLTLREAIRELRDLESELARIRNLPEAPGREFKEEDKYDTLEEDEQRFEESLEDAVFASRSGRAEGGGGGGEPNPDDDFLGLEVDLPSGRRNFRAYRSQIVKLLLVLSTIGVGIEVTRDWIASVLDRAEAGETIEIKVEDKKIKEEKTKSGAKRESGFIPPNTGTIGSPSISGNNGMTDTATYEMGIDGKPKLFPTASHGLSYNGPIDTYGSKIPWAPDVPRYTVTAPKITQPGGTITESDQLGGFDTENEQIARLIADRPDIAEHIFEYNKLVDKYNASLGDQDRSMADRLRSELRKSSQMIVGEAALKPATVGLGKSVKDLQHAIYTGKTISGGYGEFYAHKTKNERTARLGLDRDIDEYNYMVDRLNQDTYQERTQLSNVRHEFDSLRDKINSVEVQPEYGIGRANAKFISSKYPQRVRELADRALKNEHLELSRDEEQMLKEYPEIGNPVLELAEFQKHNPEGAKPNLEMRKRLWDLKKIQQANYALPQSRAFAEGGHRVSPVLQRLIDRISNDTQESQKNFVVTKEERAELERFPDLKAKVERYEYEVKRLNELYANPNQPLLPGEIDSSSVSDDIRKIRDEGYRTSELAEYSMAELDARLQDDRAAVQEALTNFRIAQSSGANRSDLAILYQRLNAAKSRLAADEHDAAGRGTFLAERGRELLPQNEEELKQFQRLQAVEAALQGEPEVLVEYNRGVSELPMGGLSPSQYYEYRLKLLRDAAARAGVSQTYDQAIASAGQPMDETIVNLPDDAAATERQGEGTERANTVDPDEAKLFMMSGAQNRKQFQNWLKFSYVAPGFGLGGPAQNPLARCNASMDARRFSSAQDVPTRSRKPMVRPVEDPMRHQNLINPYVSSFGKIHMKDAFHNNYADVNSKKVIWSNPFGDINSTRDVRQSESIYDPDYTDFRYDELTGTRYGRHSVPIGEISKPAEYRFTNERYYDTNGFNYKQQNVLNLFAPEGDRTMITKDRAGLDDRGIIESRTDWHTYGRTRMRPLGAPGFRSTKF